MGKENSNVGRNIGRRKKNQKRPWVENPLNYYRTHHSGMKSGQVSKINNPFYQHLQKKGLLDQLPGTEKHAWAEDPLAYYQQHHAGLTRGALRKINFSLYQYLQRQGLLKDVPKTEKSKWLDDPLGYYEEHHPGVTRGNLYSENPGFYALLRARDLLGNIPLLYPQKTPHLSGQKAPSLAEKHPWRDDPLGYYRKHYGVFNREELHIINLELYNILLERGLLKYVPKAKKHN